ncbi:hypothetical protein GCM10011488_35630 [Steroidobacter agaridevorans]|nr:hypothetical protein GCM10011488_35630 [Steroidobacter agaridevorans]
MDLCVMFRTYDGGGYNLTLSAVGDFLVQGAPDFGPAVKQIEVTLFLRHTSAPRATLGGDLKEHRQLRATLPKTVYRRAKGKVEIDVASGLLSKDVWARKPRPSLPMFVRAIDEVTSALSLLSKRLKPTDAFDVAALLSHCEAAKKRMPRSQTALKSLMARLKAQADSKRAALSPWERLDIDWEEFHPAARDLLDDPFFWDPTDDFSPNGNDTGADLLESYRDWIKRRKQAQPMQFLERLADDWGYESFAAIDDEHRDEAAVGLAFADLKLRGECDPEARALALAAIERQRREAEAAKKWKHREEQLQALEKIERKLTPGRKARGGKGPAR